MTVPMTATAMRVSVQAAASISVGRLDESVCGLCRSGCGGG